MSEAETPVFDGLWTAELAAAEAAATQALAEAFEPWGLDEIMPLPVESMIKDLKAQVGDGASWAIEQDVAHEIMAKRLVSRYGEEDDDDDTDAAGPAGDADVADPAAGPAVVGGDDPDNSDNPEGS